MVVHAGLVLDASGSMRCAADNGSSKTKMDVALDSLWDMFKQVSSRTRHIVASINDEADQLFAFACYGLLAKFCRSVIIDRVLQLGAAHRC